MSAAAALSEPLFRARGLRIESTSSGTRRTLVAGIDLEVREGEAVGIVGESGSGKSLTARALIGLPPPGVEVSGERSYAGRSMGEMRERELARLRGSEIGLVLQDPFTALNPLRRCGDHIDEVLRKDDGRRRSRAERRAEVTRRLAEVGIDDPDVAERFPFQLSGGMRQRVAIAAALAGNPRLLVADEPSTALDTITQKEILELLASLRRERGMAMVLITHDLRVAFSVCDRIYVLYAGQVLETGPSDELEAEPLHPYTLGLFLSEPPIDRRLEQLVGIAGSVPRAADVLESCAFAQRCEWAQAACVAKATTLAPVGGRRSSSCIRLQDIRTEMTRIHDEAVHRVIAPPARDGGTPLVRVEGVGKTFRNGVRHSIALRGVDLEVRAGESVGLVGTSGSGKTTLARCLVGLESVSEGRIEINGVDATDFSRLSRQQLRDLRRTIQYVFQDPYSSLNPSRTVGATLAEALAVGEAEQRGAQGVAALLDRVGLPADYARRKPVLLSGGERQRVAIARALAVSPTIIVCDEPVSALDVSVQAQILSVLRELNARDGIGYLFITHDLAVVRQVVDRIYVLHGGRIVEHGSVDAVLDSPGDAYTKRLLEAVPSSTMRTRGGPEQPAAGPDPAGLTETTHVS